MRFAAALLLVALPTTAQAATPITGKWVTDDQKAIVTIQPCGSALCGHVTRLLKVTAGVPKTDVRNPDPALRSRPMLGLAVLTEFTDSGSDWRGKIYSPEEGKTYKSIVSRNPDGTLKVKGCISFFCRTLIWRPAA
jgi:uncharacterized protein (DUF2147 family)